MDFEQTPATNRHQSLLLPETAGQAGKTWNKMDLAAAGLDERFTSQHITVGNVDLHAVVGGQGEPLLLVPGWPQTWYAWRKIIPMLADSFTVVAVDPRGIGGSDVPLTGYDLKTVGDELTGCMETLGYREFLLAGHDVGTWIAYAMLADHPQRIKAGVLSEAIIPGLVPSPPLFMPQERIKWAWHFSFNRTAGINEILVHGKEREFLANQFEVKAHVKEAITDADIDLYARSYADPDHLRASFDYYRAFDQHVQQNEQRKKTPILPPVLALGGGESMGAGQENILKPYVKNLSACVLDGAGHYPAEESPEQLSIAFSEFFKNKLAQ